MNKLNIKNLLTAIQNMIMRNRVAYKDYLGKETVVKPVLLASGLANGDNVEFNLTEGQSYDIDFGDERMTLTAKCRECDDSFPEWFNTTPVLDNFQDNYVLPKDMSTWPTNSFCVCVHSGTIQVACTGEYADKSLSIYRNDQVTKNKYDIKLLPEELLPKSVAKKKDVDKVNTIFSTQVGSINNKIDNLGNDYVSVWYDQDFSDVRKKQARKNIGASDFSGNFGDLADAPLKYKKTRTLAYDFDSDYSVYSYRYSINNDSRGTVFLQANTVDIAALTTGAMIQIILPYTGDNYWVSQESTVKTIDGSDGTVFRYAGNLSLMWATYIFTTKKLEGFPKDSYPAYSEVQDTGEDFLLIVSGDPNPSYFFVSTHNVSGPRKLYTITEEIEPLDDRLLADNIQRVGSDLIINSSTEGSTKKFKLVVDDSGEVSATEITG
nr:MAG TPA: hypothetical protein [Caudoviricetes sp.]